MSQESLNNIAHGILDMFDVAINKKKTEEQHQRDLELAQIKANSEAHNNQVKFEQEKELIETKAKHSTRSSKPQENLEDKSRVKLAEDVNNYLIKNNIGLGKATSINDKYKAIETYSPTIADKDFQRQINSSLVNLSDLKRDDFEEIIKSKPKEEYEKFIENLKQLSHLTGDIVFYDEETVQYWNRLRKQDYQDRNTLSDEPTQKNIFQKFGDGLKATGQNIQKGLSSLFNTNK